MLFTDGKNCGMSILNNCSVLPSLMAFKLLLHPNSCFCFMYSNNGCVKLKLNTTKSSEKRSQIKETKGIHGKKVSNKRDESNPFRKRSQIRKIKGIQYKLKKNTGK